MDVLGFIAEMALGIVFVVAGASKVARGREWPVQAAELGAPRPVALVVPWWEMTVGALLVAGLGSPWAAIAALVTLIGFTAAIVVQLRRGRHPQCACFGAWSTAPLGGRHVARNAGFAALAVLAALFG
ncbi:MAG: DoxX family membrane protein [Actinobacteria bacterium]|nr:DoxX family membrane protein [Actinomycetota bacterium]